MEAREEVEETEDGAKLQRLLQLNRQQQEGIVRRLGRAFDSPSGSRCLHVWSCMCWLCACVYMCNVHTGRLSGSSVFMIIPS